MRKIRLALLLVGVAAFAVVAGAVAKPKPVTNKPKATTHAAKPASHKPGPVRTTPKVPNAGSFDGQLAQLGLVCSKPTVDLSGSLGSVGGGFMAVAVAKATGKATTLVDKQVAVRLLPLTKIERGGSAKASDLKAGDALKLQALTCSQGLVAKQVVATPKQK